MTEHVESDPFDCFERLGMVAEALTGDVGPDEIVEIVIRQGMAGMGAAGGIICSLDGGMLVAVAAAGVSLDAVRRLGPQSIDKPFPMTDSARTGESIWVTDRQEGMLRYGALAEAQPMAEAWAALPLAVGGRIFGAFSLTFTGSRRFDPSERQFIKALTDVAALALSRHLLVPGPGD